MTLIKMGIIANVAIGDFAARPKLSRPAFCPEIGHSGHSEPPSTAQLNDLLPGKAVIGSPFHLMAVPTTFLPSGNRQ
jgi:hypothetical protein